MCELIDATGLRGTKLIGSTFESAYRCEQLLFVTDVSGNYAPTEQVIRSLRTALLQRNWHNERHAERPVVVLASRSDASSRHPAFERWLPTKYSVETVQFSKLSAWETIDVCQRADILIGGHGAALSNVIFCRPHTVLIEVIPGIDYLLYGRLASVCEVRHFAIGDDEESIKSLLGTTLAVPPLKVCAAGLAQKSSSVTPPPSPLV
jgi:capsular polysaccharide biosynthesis protein